jgi:hypothetical protein
MGSMIIILIISPPPSRLCTSILYPTEEWGIAWDLREMGSTWGGVMREGPAPQTESKISSEQQYVARRR